MLNWLHEFQLENHYHYFNDVFRDNCNPFVTLVKDYQRIYKEELSFRSRPYVHFRNTNYCFIRRGSSQLIFDIGSISADHITGHGHADIGSFEYVYDNVLIIRNVGTSTYANNQRRKFERSSAAHNTLSSESGSSSNIWSSFRTAERIKDSQ